ncbi:hypothetical protein HY626_01180 [Candidatus Uhrbacteria bacterium]|nr:hypothetical protein [Candidatus Uhrbacteria bacterium]
MTPINDEIRIRNPFHDPLVSELIEDPALYRQMFSERILVGETLGVFQPANVVLVGPQGCGKSMILNLIRYSVVAEWISKFGEPPAPLKHVTPFFGISINLVRASFHAFGRRSVSRVIKGGESDESLDATCAADFLNHYLFREFLHGMELLLGNGGSRLRKWLGIRHSLPRETVIGEMGLWESWFGYYRDCRSLESLLGKCEKRLSTWRSFLNGAIDEIPKEIWETKSTLGEPLHSMGNFLRSLGHRRTPVPLFVVIDQYEVLPELNLTYGTTLQRIVNTLIKSRDPVVFYKIGARTHDWGTELRIWGAESRIEVQRDYVFINLGDLLMRGEDGGGWLFPHFARDVAHKRVLVEGYTNVTKERIERIFGKWNAERESSMYFKKKERWFVVLRNVPETVKRRIGSLCGRDSSPLELRLAGAWAIQRLGRGMPMEKVLEELRARPWRNWSWKKERVSIALLQIASLSNQRKRYYGWTPLLYLSGSNISAFLLLCGEIWDVATKMDIHPLGDEELKPIIQTEGILLASEKWRERDRNENIGGRKRYEVLGRLGPAIHDALIGDLGISNPGHSGFSLREADLWTGEEQDEKKKKLTQFLQNAVNWAIFEERPHTSKLREGASRRKWYLHPLLSPIFAIPYVRAKEPLYTNVDDVYTWIFSGETIRFGKTQRSLNENGHQTSRQLSLRFKEKR